jgi:beta-glucanase (GH16 family)
VNISPTGAAGKNSTTSTTTTSPYVGSGKRPSATWIEAIGPALDMSNLVKTFDTTFATTDDLKKITNAGAGGPWYAPIHSDYSPAHFVTPTSAVSPFAIDNGKLRIRCEMVNGRWQSGHMQTCDFAGSGFSQKRGYFEIRCKFPPPLTIGAWPAFWMYSKTFFTDPNMTRAELDVIEYYAGSDSRGHHSAIHLHPGTTPYPGALTKDWYTSCYTGLNALQDGQYHTHGVEITADWIIIYFDRVEIKRVKTLVEFDAPLFMMVSLALVPTEAPSAIGPIDFYVDYVRAWQRV